MGNIQFYASTGFSQLFACAIIKPVDLLFRHLSDWSGLPLGCPVLQPENHFSERIASADYLRIKGDESMDYGISDFMQKTHGTWVDIDLDALSHNLREIQRLAGPHQKLCAVVKADAYGHGAVVYARFLEAHGVQQLAVASISEGIELRNAGCKLPLLLLGWTPDFRAEDLLNFDLTPTVFTVEQARHFSSVARHIKSTMKVHVKIDTGMNRLGFLPTDESREAILSISRLPGIEIEGIFSHLALFFTDDNRFSLQQTDRFLTFVKQLERDGLFIPLRHIANSAGLIDVPGDGFNMVRVGSALYGLAPRTGIPQEVMNLKPAMTFKTTISHVKDLKAGEGVSYGHAYIAPSDRRIATIPVGYVDGITKIGSGRTYALTGKKRVLQIGLICMDQCLLDVTDAGSVSQGDEVILFGSDGVNTITPEERAEILGTGNCEIVCAVSRRVPRVYRSNGQVVKVVNYLLDPHGQ
jgi:alanine racemase